jgi:hypothetical protein
MSFRDGSDKGTASNCVQISEKVRRRPWQWLDKNPGKKSRALHERSKLIAPEIGETSEEKSQEHVHYFL